VIGRRTFIQLLTLIACLPLGELYIFFHVPELRERNWFISSEVKQDIEWYIKDSSEAIVWIVFLAVWYFREKNRAVIFSRYIAAFCVYRVTDLFFYWYNYRAASGGYVICYFILLFSILLIITKK